jgi:NTE family protein
VFWGTKKHKKLGLALGGGTIRAMAHIGVLKIFEKHHLPIDFIAGTSSGSLIATLFAAGISALRMEKYALPLRMKNLLKPRFRVWHGLLSSHGIEELLGRFIGVKHFEDLKIPLAIATTDLLSGEEVILKSGNVINAVRASCSFPGLFAPMNIGDRLLIDGGITNNIPVKAVREMGADVVVGVDIIPNAAMIHKPHHTAQIVNRAVDLLLKKTRIIDLNEVDFVIEPVNQYIDSFDFSANDKLIKMGEEAAEKMVEHIKRKLQ